MSGSEEIQSAASPMSTPSTHAPEPRPAAPHARPSRLAALRRSLTGLAFLAAAGLAWWWLSTHHFAGTEHEDHAAPGASGSGRPAEPAAPAVVTLPPGVAADEIDMAEVVTRPMQNRLTVPGRLDYDASSRLEYDSPVDGIVSRLFVTVRQHVDKGASLAAVSSPEVGVARDEVKKREDDREIARKAADWANTVADNVQSLLVTLESHPPLDVVEEQFAGHVLGEYREKIMAAYSRLLYVEKVQAGTQQLGEGGVLSGRIIDERTSNLEVARASFTAACESAKFTTLQERDKAKAALEQAERLVRVSRENLRTLVGSRLEASDADVDDDVADGEISAIVLRTPFAGIVDEIFVSRGQRVKSGDQLFVVADTSDLWVRAQVHEKQWTTVELAEGQEVRVTVPGAAEHRTTARVKHIGGTVDAESRSVAIVGSLTNDDAHYKPGMFVWVELPQGEPHEALAVPAAAVMRHEGKAFVFTPTDDGGFRRTDVETGIETDNLVEITRGLQAGQRVVARGAFLVKSELLLEDEG